MRAVSDLCCLGRIEESVRSTWLGTEDDSDVGPDWVYIKGTWYRDNEVQKATLQETHEYHTALVVSDNEVLNLVDDGTSGAADVGTKHDKPLKLPQHAKFMTANGSGLIPTLST